MKTELYTVSKIFNENLYRIPDYQRGYSWELQQLKDFWLDLEQLEGDKSHYTGVLTLEPVPPETLKEWTEDIWIVKSKKYQPYFVVDGQQRLTTTVVLIQCILELDLPAKLNHTLIEDIRRKYIFDSKDEMSRSYIFGYVVDNPSYEYLITNIFNESSKKHSVDEETIYTKNLSNAKNFFKRQLAGMTMSQVEVLFTKVTQQLVFNVYEIAKEIDVFVTFETMNNRGKLLSNLELVKNRLIFLAMKMGPNDEDAARLRFNINEAWKTIYHFLGKNEARPLGDDVFLRSHMLHYFFSELKKLPEDQDERVRSYRQMSIAVEEIGRFLLNELFTQKRLKPLENDQFPKLTPAFVNSYASALKDAVKVYYKLSTPLDSGYTELEALQLERIGRLRGYNPSPILLTVFLKEKDAKKRWKFLELWERLSFLVGFRSHNPYMRHVGFRTDQAEFIGGKQTFEEVCTGLENNIAELLREGPLVEVLADWMKDGPGFYGWRTLKYFLYEYEISLASSSKTQRLKIDWATFCGEDFANDYDTVEHIYPQRARHQYWVDRFGKFPSNQKRALRNSLGNLLALSRPKNSSLGNQTFPDKKGKEGSTVGYRYGGYSENQVAAEDEWGPIEILSRGVNMLTFLERRWGLVIGDSRLKAKALGLEFLVK